MANSKNTVQNIPLTGPLCLNTLKTDVAQFEGYNEKNSTVFGGELTPIRSKETTLGNKDSTYTIFNSKGEPFTLNLENRNVTDRSGSTVAQVRFPLELEDCAPKDAYWYAFLFDDSGSLNDFSIAQVYIDTSGKLWGRYYRFIVPIPSGHHSVLESIETLLNKEYQLLYDFGFDVNGITSVDAKAYTSSGTSPSTSFVIAVSTLSNTTGSHYYYYGFYQQPNYGFNSEKTYSGSGELTNFSSSSFVVISQDREYQGRFFISFVPFSGKNVIDTSARAKVISVSGTSPSITSTDEEFYYTTRQYKAYLTNDPYYSGPAKTVEVYPDFCIMVTVRNDYPYFQVFGENSRGYTGHDGKYFIPGVKSYGDNSFINGSLYATTLLGRLVRQPGTIKTPFFHRGTYSKCLSFKDTDEKWYTYFTYPIVTGDLTSPLIKGSIEKFAVLDNRYFPVTGGFYDIEEKKLIKTVLDYIDNTIPYSKVEDGVQYSKTGIVYASGFNVNYPITNTPFVGHLMNPKVMTDFPVKESASGAPFYKDVGIAPGRWAGIDYFYSVGDNVQSAEYHGNNPEYDGTVYPIDSNGNIIYPITWESKVLNGYSNNDFIKEGKTAYPLIYWNNNQKMYAYYLLSSMENVEGAFSLQGQQYTFDYNNIYNVQFTNGVIQGVNSVCYKKNMMFLGTLPKAAIFYSKFNKTFYQFTGDTILSKMFEASDINEIKFVGQNPSSLSLWICTDNGVYIMSDTDMFKVDYDVKDIYFEETKAILVTENETNWVENDISLYDIGDDAVETPIKLHTKFYGIGAEQKVTYDCWYIRLHNKDHKAGKLKLKVNTITNTSFETEEKTYDIEPSMYDGNDTIFIRYQPKYQSAVAAQLELESDIAIYQISLGVNTTDAVAQQSKFNF